MTILGTWPLSPLFIWGGGQKGGKLEVTSFSEHFYLYNTNRLIPYFFGLFCVKIICITHCRTKLANFVQNEIGQFRCATLSGTFFYKIFFIFKHFPGNGPNKQVEPARIYYLASYLLLMKSLLLKND